MIQSLRAGLTRTHQIHSFPTVQLDSNFKALQLLSYPKSNPEEAFILYKRFFMGNCVLYLNNTWLSFYFVASQRPVPWSQKPSRSSSCCGGALSSGDDGVPYAFLRLFPHPKLALVLTPVTGFVPLAYLQSAWQKSRFNINLNIVQLVKHVYQNVRSHGFWTCFWRRSMTASLKSAPTIMAPPRSLRVSTDRTRTAFVKFASFSTWIYQ